MLRLHKKTVTKASTKDLRAKCAALVEQGDPVAAVHAYRKETRTPLPTALTALGLYGPELKRSVLTSGWFYKAEIWAVVFGVLYGLNDTVAGWPALAIVYGAAFYLYRNRRAPPFKRGVQELSTLDYATGNCLVGALGGAVLIPTYAIGMAIHRLKYGHFGIATSGVLVIVLSAAAIVHCRPVVIKALQPRET